MKVWEIPETRWTRRMQVTFVSGRGVAVHNGDIVIAVSWRAAMPRIRVKHAKREGDE